MCFASGLSVSSACPEDQGAAHHRDRWRRRSPLCPVKGIRTATATATSIARPPVSLLPLLTAPQRHEARAHKELNVRLQPMLEEDERLAPTVTGPLSPSGHPPGHVLGGGGHGVALSLGTALGFPRPRSS